MLNFKSWLAESSKPRGNYVSVASELPKLDLIEFKSGKTTPESDAHVTVMYSKETAIPDDVILKRIGHLGVTSVARVTGIDCFGKESGTGCVVLKLDAPRLEQMHQELIELGCQHSYDEFKPHLTLAYDVDLDECERIMQKFKKLYGKETIFVQLRNLKSEPVMSNWSDKL